MLRHYDDVMIYKCFLHHWIFVMGIQQWWVDDCWWFELPWYSYDVTLMWRLSLGFRMPSVNITGRMWQSPGDCPHKGRAMQKVYPCHYGIGDVLASECHQWTSQGVCGSHLWIALTKGQQCRKCVHVIMVLAMSWLQNAISGHHRRDVAAGRFSCKGSGGSCLTRTYQKISNIRCTKSQNLNDSHLILQSPLLNPLKPGLKSRMKM